MLNRRQCLAAGLLLAGPILAPILAGGGAQAQGVDRATAFVKQTGDQMVAVVNGPGGLPEKRQALTQIVDSSADVEGVARFCLGRFWRTATPEQQARYLAAFHNVLVSNISAKLGEYRGVRMNVQRGRQQDGDAVVTTIVERPNNPPATVDWVIGQPAANPKLIDVVAEGTSLRLTQRQDYASYLSRNNNNIDALIVAMNQQVTRTQ